MIQLDEFHQVMDEYYMNSLYNPVRATVTPEEFDALEDDVSMLLAAMENHPADGYMPVGLKDGKWVHLVPKPSAAIGPAKALITQEKRRNERRTPEYRYESYGIFHIVYATNKFETY